MYGALEPTNVDDNVQTVPARGHHEADGRGEPQQDAGAAGQVQRLQVQSRLKVRYLLLFYTARDILMMCPRSLLCGPRGERGTPGSYAGEREQALALLAAAKHLPSQLLSSQAEVKGKYCLDRLAFLFLTLNNQCRHVGSGCQDAG